MKEIILTYLRRFPLDYFKHAIAKIAGLNKLKGRVEYTNNLGTKFKLDLAEYQMRQIYLFDFYEKNTIRHLFKLLIANKKKRLTVVDVGANIGFYSLTLSTYLHNREVAIFSFEPNPETRKIFDSNVVCNKFTNIKIEPMGLSDQPGVAQLRFNSENTGTASIYGKESARFVTEIELTTLDDYCDKNNIQDIDLIKVDIEGGEFKFLTGARRIIQRSSNTILVMELIEEHCKRAGYTANVLYEEVIGMGFKAYLPKPWPFGLKQINQLPENYCDNIIFIKSFNNK